jgi:hypothetical protein
VRRGGELEFEVPIDGVPDAFETSVDPNARAEIPSSPGAMTRSRSRRLVLATALVLTMVATSCGGDDGGSDGDEGRATTTTIKPTDRLPLNEIQVIGTHNSFHVVAPPEERELLEALDLNGARQRRYSHRPLTEQLEDQKIRQIELDLYADAAGGRYADPALRRQAGLPPLLDEVPAMAEPGTKVLHEQDVDYHSVCPTLVSCLTELKIWSDANPTHVPVAVHVQLKDGALIFAVPDQTVPERWTTEAMDALDAEITSVFPLERIITPDDVRGDAATLEEAVLDDGWPSLGESRGKVLFLMTNPEPYRSIYLKGHEGLAGRILFTNAEPGEPDAAYMSVDDPIVGRSRIDELVRRGYLVRTRADVPDVQGRTGETARRDAALASGAQWVSTDYPGPEGANPQFGTNYIVALPDGRTARCNPVTAAPDCKDIDVEPRRSRPVSDGGP